ncbi:coenzyme F420-dependent NADP oxidoreductase [Flammeovirgaceae bacterium 311]|nr:coenzyme F420-dependent NADP oxidoreductase [Flammeovirgaceae bacterium 311]
MKKVSLIGAGGKMGCRITDNLKNSEYEVSYIEINPQGIERLKARGVDVSKAEDVIPAADFVILAVPDIYIKNVARDIVPQMKPGAVAVCLDPAAPLAGALPERADISYFATHPAHPSIFNHEDKKENHYDYFGGISAKQAIVCALISGKEEDYEAAEQLAIQMYAPVFRSHRITIEQMGILEPALSETFTATCLLMLKEGLDEAVKQGVPKEAARDFLLGHINIIAAVLFDEIPGVFSDACYKAIEYGKPKIFRDDWKKIFEPESVKEQIKAIT